MQHTASVNAHSSGHVHIANERRNSQSWFLDSIEVLLEVARQEADADGFAFYEFDQAAGQFVPRAVRGMPIRVPQSFPTTVTERPLRLAAQDHGLAIMTYPLKGRNGLAGTVNFAFSEPGNAAPGYRDVLQHAADAAEALLQAAGSSTFLLHLTARISELEGKLAGLKIRERAQGLLHRDTHYSRSEALNSHVAGVLQLCELEQILSRRLQEAEQRLAERQVVSQAKAALERALGLTEEEAYSRLREVSRRTRTKLSEVAADVVAGGGILTGAHRLSA